MGTKKHPGPYDCYAKAQTDEPLFTLMARDASAPGLIRHWADLREEDIRCGRKPKSDQQQVWEARHLANQFEHWRDANRKRSTGT